MSALVSPEMLLSRKTEPVYGPEAKNLIAGKTVLVTGAGGSIGSEIVRQCMHLGARRIVKVDSDETALFNLSLDIFGHALFVEQDDLHLVDVTDQLAISRLISSVKPDVVFHAAAKKHLSLVQAHPNTAIRVNVFGTLSVMKAAVEYGVPRVVNISSDKAANPSSILGWSKRMAELIGAHYSSEATRITSVRFGNVLGSNGSLLPILQYKLQNNLPVQVTHPDVSRYFMTIPEATGLVIESARMSVGGEVFILDMDVSVKVIDLISDYARLAHMPMPEIQFIGLRPGEKLREELFSRNERYNRTTHPRINTALIADQVDVVRKLNELDELLATTVDPATLRDTLTLNRKEPHVVLADVDRTTALLGLD